MARRRLKANEYREDRAIRENRGTGTGETYTPWIQVGRNEFPSHGITEFRPSALFERHQTVLSLLELEALRVLQLMNPRDVREQFKLVHEGVEAEFSHSAPHAAGSVEIAASFGLKHPMIRLGKPLSMTTDFLLNRRDACPLAVHVKYKKDLEKERNAELRRIEHEYWRQRGVEFTVFTEQEINKTAKGNLILFECFHKESVWRKDVRLHMEIAQLAGVLPMLQVLEIIRQRRALPTAVTADVIKFAISTGRLRLDLSAFAMDWSQIWPPMLVVAYSDDISESIECEGAIL